MNAVLYYASPEFEIQMELVVRILKRVVYLFGALILHFLLYFAALQFRHWRQTRNRTVVTVQTVTGLGSMTGVAVLMIVLWYPPYSRAIQEKRTYDTHVRQDTHQYLKEWLEDEPESPHANALMGRLTEDEMFE